MLLILLLLGLCFHYINTVRIYSLQCFSTNQKRPDLFLEFTGVDISAGTNMNFMHSKVL